MGAAVALEVVEAGAGNAPAWQEAHEKLVALAAQRAGLDADEGRWLLEALRSGTHVRLGYGGFNEYVERLFGYSPRFTQERLRVAEALEELSELRGAVSSGALNWSVVRELTRVATPNTESEWLAAARGLTARDAERLVSGHKPGSRPSDTANPAAKRHTLKFDVSAETLATVRDALAKLRRDAGAPLDDDAALLLMARQILGGPTDEGRASYQVYLNVCEHCGSRSAAWSGRAHRRRLRGLGDGELRCPARSRPHGRQTAARHPDDSTGSASERRATGLGAVRGARLPARHIHRRPPHRSESRRRRPRA